MIYFAEAVGLNKVKIGMTRDAEQRVETLQQTSPVEIKLLRCVEGWRYTEAWYHRHFAPRRSHYEWFLFDPDMLKVKPHGRVGELAVWLDRHGVNNIRLNSKTGIAYPIISEMCAGIRTLTPEVVEALEAMADESMPCHLKSAEIAA